MSSTSESAICDTARSRSGTSPRCEPLRDVRARTVGIMRRPVARSVGAMPNNTPVNMAHAAVKASTRASGVTSSTTGVCPREMKTTRSRVAQWANPTPTTPPSATG